MKIDIGEREAVMVLSKKAYVALKSSAKSDAPNFVAHLLAMPREPYVRVAEVAPAESRAKLALRDRKGGDFGN